MSNDKINLKDALETPVWLMVYATDPLRPIDVTMTYYELKCIYDRVREIVPEKENEKCI